MVLRLPLAERPVDSNPSKMYSLDNRASSRVFTSTIPYLTTHKEVELQSPSPAAKKSVRSRVSFGDSIAEECCVYDPRFAPNSITNHRSSSKTEVTQSTSGRSSSKAKVTQTTNAASANFLNSKVFVKILNKAAVTIQAQARRAIQHKRYLCIVIAKVEAEIHALHVKEVAIKLDAAATKMQALGRGGICRLHFQITKLELRLLQSNLLLKTQLEDIQKDKERQMAAIYEEKNCMEKLAKDRADMFKKNNENVKQLRKENKSLRSENKKLQRSIDIFKNLNNRLEQLTEGFGEESIILKKIISGCEEKNREWEHLVGLYEDRIVKYKDVLEERSDRRFCESQIAEKTRESIVAIVSVVTDESEDEELVRTVVELGKPPAV
jgi:hypothetical protein